MTLAAGEKFIVRVREGLWGAPRGGGGGSGHARGTKTVPHQKGSSVRWMQTMTTDRMIET